ncbi:hypothetical protein ABZV28_17710 [Streptomyces sp. NPDC004981]|uniref:hypothetical protein n=1 Tax=Streptomyces sp. NPDC004981 TaxID=3156655 RepID=UPI0033AECC60
MELFARLSGRDTTGPERRMLEELVGLCGYLPLGVSLLSARLRRHPLWGVEDLRQRVVVAQGRLGEIWVWERAVAAAFDLSYADLPAGRQRFFRRLGQVPGTDIDAYVAAALDSVTVAEARRQLAALYDDHLIDENPGSRYRLYDLVRDYASLSWRARGLVSSGIPASGF